jgi:hypothetical protein
MEGRLRNRTVVSPELRFLARMIDYGFFFFLLYWVAPEMIRWLWIVPLHFAAWIPIETVFLMMWGTTLGKWLVKTNVKKGHAKRIPFDCALRRSMAVWVRGIGLGITGINILCMANAYRHLQVRKVTGWDRDEGTQVMHHHVGRARVGCAVFLAVGGMGFYFFYV